MPIIMKAGEDDYVKKIISVNVIDREEDLFLCRLKTLREWKSAVFYEKNEMEFSYSNKRFIMEMSKGGHQLVKLEMLGEWIQERSVMYIKGNDENIDKKYVEKVHRVLNHVNYRS